ncbi:MAG: Phosphoribosyltransferase [Parcubacteria group bacterium GW2011_GWC2_45_7]|nr:MAG: Phosphoribosyltransferase [Parcubacteria group bacterium GW2011_GWC2_45_7]KKU74015.1 MAG: Phosphoribosyltransferase [Parcubacteria group bacterium GW2011_GWA2_47_26]
MMWRNGNKMVRLMLFQRCINFTIDTLFPIECLGCKKEGEWLCQDCLAKIPIETKEDCFVCKKPSAGGKTCFSCQRNFSLQSVAWLTDYDNALVHRALHIAKYGYVKAVLVALLNSLVPHLSHKFRFFDLDPRAVMFIPVPLHLRRLRDRGFNQAQIVAESFARATNGICVNALTRRRFTIPQVKLDEADRARNIKGVFKCLDQATVADHYVFIVDDVATSGATLNACGEELQKAGARGVFGLVIAKG